MLISNIRNEYNRPPLLEKDVDPNPVTQFGAWMADAIDSDDPEPTAMGLATVSEGRPSLRIVLLKGFDDSGFVFFTNYQSQKGNHLDSNPYAALNLFWKSLHRQVRIEGMVEKLSESESDAYYQTRARGSRIGAWASPQSQVLSSRAELERMIAETEEKFEGQEAFPKPPFWGGYRLKPNRIEFWQGRPSRLHDRLLYTLSDNRTWNLERLAP